MTFEAGAQMAAELNDKCCSARLASAMIPSTCYDPVPQVNLAGSSYVPASPGLMLRVRSNESMCSSLLTYLGCDLALPILSSALLR